LNGIDCRIAQAKQIPHFLAVALVARNVGTPCADAGAVAK
jgi:hypothetical protein